MKQKPTGTDATNSADPQAEPTALSLENALKLATLVASSGLLTAGILKTAVGRSAFKRIIQFVVVDSSLKVLQTTRTAWKTALEEARTRRHSTDTPPK